MENVVSAALTYEGADIEFTVTFAHEFSLTGKIDHVKDQIYRVVTSNFDYYFDAAKVIHIRRKSRR